MIEKGKNAIGLDDIIFLKNANDKDKEIPLFKSYKKILIITSIPLTMVCILIMAIIIVILCLHKHIKKKN